MNLRNQLACAVLAACLGAALAGEKGTLSGRIVFEGPLPETFHFDLAVKPADLPICSAGAGALKPAKRLQVDQPGLGVGSVVVRVTTLEGKTPAGAKPFPAKRKPLLDQVACEFTPFVEWVEAGQSLRLRSSDAVMHNVHAYKEKIGGETLFNEAMPEKDKTITKKFDDPGLVLLACDAGHLWMSAYIFAVDNPYVEVTARDGAYKMEDLPPGRYKASFWQAGWTVTPGPNNLKTGKPTHYTFSEPLLLEVPIEIKAGENTLGAVLTKEGWKK